MPLEILTSSKRIALKNQYVNGLFGIAKLRGQLQ
jgi:hypothetical protein